MYQSCSSLCHSIEKLIRNPDRQSRQCLTTSSNQLPEPVAVESTLIILSDLQSVNYDQNHPKRSREKNVIEDPGVDWTPFWMVKLQSLLGRSIWKTSH